MPSISPRHGFTSTGGFWLTFVSLFTWSPGSSRPWSRRRSSVKVTWNRARFLRCCINWSWTWVGRFPPLVRLCHDLEMSIEVPKIEVLWGQTWTAVVPLLILGQLSQILDIHVMQMYVSMYLCMHVRMYVCACVRVRVRVRGRVRVCTCTCASVCVCVCVCICMYMYVYGDVYVCLCMYMHLCMFMYLCIYVKCLLMST